MKKGGQRYATGSRGERENTGEEAVYFTMALEGGNKGGRGGLIL